MRKFILFPTGAIKHRPLFGKTFGGKRKIKSSVKKGKVAHLSILPAIVMDKSRIDFNTTALKMASKNMI